MRCTTEIHCNKLLSVLNQSIGSQVSYPGDFRLRDTTSRCLDTPTYQLRTNESSQTPQSIPTRKQVLPLFSSYPTYQVPQQEGDRIGSTIASLAQTMRQFCFSLPIKDGVSEVVGKKTKMQRSTRPLLYLSSRERVAYQLPSHMLSNTRDMRGGLCTKIEQV